MSNKGLVSNMYFLKSQYSVRNQTHFLNWAKDLDTSPKIIYRQQISTEEQLGRNKLKPQ